jgi:hypothetical protein
MHASVRVHISATQYATILMQLNVHLVRLDAHPSQCKPMQLSVHRQSRYQNSKNFEPS